MNDPSLALQRAWFAALTGDSRLSAVIAGRVYDRPPPKPTFPYVTIGDDQVLGDDVDFTEDSIVHPSASAWSQATDRGEVKLVGGLVRDVLIRPLVLPGFRVVYGKFVSALTKPEPDMLTWQRILTFEFRIQPLA